MEQEAKAKNLGLWQDKNVTSPWIIENKKEKSLISSVTNNFYLIPEVHKFKKTRENIYISPLFLSYLIKISIGENLYTCKMIKESF